MTTQSRRSRWAKRAGIPVALMVMGGIGVTFAMPASADTDVLGRGATPEAATQEAAAACTSLGLDPGTVLEQKSLPEGGWEVKMRCVERTNPGPSGLRLTAEGATPEEAHAAAKAGCVSQNLIAGNLLGMEQLNASTWSATIECLNP